MIHRMISGPDARTKRNEFYFSHYHWKVLKYNLHRNNSNVQNYEDSLKRLLALQNAQYIKAYSHQKTRAIRNALELLNCNEMCGTSFTNQCLVWIGLEKCWVSLPWVCRRMFSPAIASRCPPDPPGWFCWWWNVRASRSQWCQPARWSHNANDHDFISKTRQAFRTHFFLDKFGCKAWYKHQNNKEHKTHKQGHLFRDLKNKMRHLNTLYVFRNSSPDDTRKGKQSPECWSGSTANSFAQL